MTRGGKIAIGGAVVGAAAFMFARAVNRYRGSHLSNPELLPNGAVGYQRISWLEGAGGVLGIWKFPEVKHVEGPIDVTPPTITLATAPAPGIK